MNTENPGFKKRRLSRFTKFMGVDPRNGTGLDILLGTNYNATIFALMVGFHNAPVFCRFPANS